MKKKVYSDRNRTLDLFLKLGYRAKNYFDLCDVNEINELFLIK